MAAGGFKAGVIGFPITHSLSPRIHNFWLKQYGIEGSYEAIAVEPQALHSFFSSLPDMGYKGVNVTIPHKEQVAAIMHRLDKSARLIGAVNTVCVENGVLTGSNTDMCGFMRNLEEGWSMVPGKALVLGAGGAARAVCFGLLQAGFEVVIANRTQEKAELLARICAEAGSTHVKAIAWEKAADAMRNVTLLVNTTSAGMKGQPPLEISLEHLPSSACVTDLVYNPLVTHLLAQAGSQGNNVVDGLGMLLYQAAAAFHTWLGIMPEVNADLRQHVLEGLK